MVNLTYIIFLWEILETFQKYEIPSTILIRNAAIILLAGCRQANELWQRSRQVFIWQTACPVYLGRISTWPLYSELMPFVWQHGWESKELAPEQGKCPGVHRRARLGIDRGNSWPPEGLMSPVGALLKAHCLCRHAGWDMSHSLTLTTDTKKIMKMFTKSILARNHIM